MRHIALITVMIALPGAVHAGNELDISAGLDGGATNAADDQVGYGKLRVGYTLRPHLTISLTGMTGGASAGDRWLGGLVGAVELWQQLGKIRGAVRLGGIHQHEAPRDSLEERPGSVLGGIDDDIAHRTALVTGLSAVADVYRWENRALYGGVELTTMLWADGSGPRWTFLGGLVAGIRIDLDRSR